MSAPAFRYRAFFVVLTPQGYVGHTRGYDAIPADGCATLANSSTAKREAWWLDMEASPPTEIPDPNFRGVMAERKQKWAGLLPDQWLDTDQNLRGSDGRIIFQGPGNFPAGDSTAGLSAPVIPSERVTGVFPLS